MKECVIFTDWTDLNLKRLYKDIRRYEPLTAACEQGLIKAAQGGDIGAMHELVKHNAAFVITVAKPLQTVYTELEDLFESGIEGLIKAIYIADTSRGYKLNTIAKSHIKKAIMDYMAENRLVHLPDQELRNIRKGISTHYEVVYYDDPDTTGLEQMHIDRETDYSSTMDEIMAFLGTIPPRNSGIFMKLHGLEDGYEHAPESVANEYNCSRERIRQIDNTIIGQLRDRFNKNSVA